ncbi:MAG: hypothetical protein RIT81_08685 [Deltaproteobacteria bacterium]
MSNDGLDALLGEAGGPASSAERCVDPGAVDELAWRRYERSTANAATREQVESHLVVCAYCRHRLQIRPARSRWWWAVPLAAGIATAALLLDPGPAMPRYAIAGVRGQIADVRGDTATSELRFDGNSRIVLTLGADTAAPPPRHVAVASTDAEGRLLVPVRPSVQPHEDGTFELHVEARALFGERARSTRIVVAIADGPIEGIEGRSLDTVEREQGRVVWLTRPCKYEGVPP